MFKNILNKVGWGQLPGYTIEKLPDDQSTVPGNPLWELSNGKNKAGDLVTVFYCSKKSKSAGQLECARGAGVLKTLRHPLILKCHDFVDNESGVYVVTERVKPLTDSPHVWGLFQVVRAVQFLHKDGKSHATVDLSSIFVTRSGDYRLGGFELCGDLNRDASNIVRQRQILSMGVLDFNHPDGSAQQLDCFAVEQLIKRTFNPVPATLKPLLSRRRSQNSGFLDQLLRNTCFTENAEVKTMSFLEDLHIKEESEKEKFFELLPSVCDHLGKDLRRNQLLGYLAKVVEFPNLTAAVLVSILKIAPECSDADNQEIIVPIVSKYFASTDRSVRFRLLVSAPDYMDRVSDALVNDKIFPQLISGFTDSAPAIREATVKSLIQVMPKLKEKTRDQKVFPAMLKLLRDPEAAIRTNTVLCFGKLAQYLEGKSKVLVQAYAIALKDPFPACRSSALQAIGATLDLYAMEELSETLMPFICHRLADPDPQVSSSAFEVLPKVTEHLRPLVAKKHQELKEKQEHELQQQQLQQMQQHQSGGAPSNAPAAAGWTSGIAAMSQVAFTTIGGIGAKTGPTLGNVTPELHGSATTPPPPPPCAPAAPALGAAIISDEAWGDIFESETLDDGDLFSFDDMDTKPPVKSSLGATALTTPTRQAPPVKSSIGGMSLSTPAVSSAAKPARGMSLNSPSGVKAASGAMSLQKDSVGGVPDLSATELAGDFDFDDFGNDDLFSAKKTPSPATSKKGMALGMNLKKTNNGFGDDDDLFADMKKPTPATKSITLSNLGAKSKVPMAMAPIIPAATAIPASARKCTPMVQPAVKPAATAVVVTATTSVSAKPASARKSTLAVKPAVKPAAAAIADPLFMPTAKAKAVAKAVPIDSTKLASLEDDFWDQFN
eukprot:GEMP01004890.1.p1 GENE.GEMP01004890.1~~GEMP01004890.1.p1  ORF type:complete len:889 (+),score=225.35 GEMP01004890.1:62-2728(+)